ncbi:MFS transporter [Streptomyces sp. NPDC038707]|uniref:MFS transporter n=1 Tax=Streptomyces sp. NPDC038707 TaxID=3154329 RepID=UPI0033FFEE2A
MPVRAGFRAVFAVAGPALPAISFLARLPAAICPTATLLMLTRLDGIGRAGVTAGTLLAGQALSGPLLGRLADRRGHRPVVLAASLANAAAITFLLAAVLNEWSAATAAVAAAGVGLTVPQIGPLSRSRWIALIGALPAPLAAGRPELTVRALSFDTTVDEVSFIAGPALAGMAVVAIHPVAPMVLAGALIAVFGVLFALHPTAPPGTRSARHSGKPLLSPALVVLLLMAVLQGMIWGSANAGVSALSDHLGDAGAAGFIWGAMAVTSALAGIATTVRTAGLALTTRLRLAIAAQAILLLPLPAVEGFAGVTVVIAAIGLAVAPHLIAVFSLAERVAPPHRLSETMALLVSALIGGQGMAAVAAGQLAQHSGFRSAFLLTCGCGAAALLVALLFVRPTVFTPAIERATATVTA